MLCVVLCGVCRCGRGVIGGRGVCLCVLAHLESNSHLEGIAKHCVMSVAKSAGVGKARPSGIAKHRVMTVATSTIRLETNPNDFGGFWN